MEANQNRVVQETADAVQGSWVYRLAPTKVRPFLKLARLDRPVGTWLLLWPCWWSLALTLGGHDFGRIGWYALLFGIGALAMRGAGCTYNDIVDQDIDEKVERTRSRPIPAGEVSVKGAWAFLVAQSLVGLVVLLQFNAFAIWLGIGSLALVAVYPFMKRFTGWPQAWLGITFNWGALMGWAALEGSLGLPAIILYVGGVFWTLGYDTIYAHQDKEDDALIGIGSTALTLGRATKPMLALFYSLFFIALLVAGTLENFSNIFYVSIAFAGLHLAWQVWRVDIDDPDICLKIFRSNTAFGWIVLASLFLGYFSIGFE